MQDHEIKIGLVFFFKHKITAEEVLSFAKLTGDENKLHLDPEFGRTTRFKDNIVHGMLAGSLFSRLIGMYCPGEHGAYLSQNINFKQPIFAGEEIIIRGEIVDFSHGTRIITLKTEILKNNKIAVDGIARAILY
jgi:acyl dehydratase